MYLIAEDGYKGEMKITLQSRLSTSCSQQRSHAGEGSTDSAGLFLMWQGDPVCDGRPKCVRHSAATLWVGVWVFKHITGPTSGSSRVASIAAKRQVQFRNVRKRSGAKDVPPALPVTILGW